MIKEQHQEALAEFKGTWKLVKDLPHAVQEEEEDGSLLTRLAVGEGRLGAAVVERVTRLRQMVKEVSVVMRKDAKTMSILIIGPGYTAQRGFNTSLCDVSGTQCVPILLLV